MGLSVVPLYYFTISRLYYYEASARNRSVESVYVTGTDSNLYLAAPTATKTESSFALYHFTIG